MAENNLYVSALFSSGAVRVNPIENPFILRNGKQSILFVDHGLLLTNPSDSLGYYESLYETLVQSFQPDTTILVNVDSKSSPATTAVMAYKGGYRQILVNPEQTTKNEKGTGLRIRQPYNISSSDEIVVIDDVYTENDQTALHVINELKNQLDENHKIHLMVGLLRGNPITSATKLAEQGVELHFLITQNDILRRVWRTLDPQQQEVLENEFGSIEE